MTIYAYKSKGREEGLREHVERGLAVIKLLYEEEGYYELVAARAAISRDEAELAVKAAYVLHDVGKAFKGYQERIKRGHGAPGHEVVSAVCVLKTMRGRVKNTITNSIALAILLHHHAMRGLIKAYRKAEERLPQRLDEEYQGEMGELHDSLGIPLPPEEVSREDLGLVRNLIKQEKPYEPLAYLILHPLITGDVCSAALAKHKELVRGASVTTDELRGVLDHLMSHVREFATPRVLRRCV